MHSHALLHEDPAGGSGSASLVATLEVTSSCTYTISGYDPDDFVIVRANVEGERDFSWGETYMVLPEYWYYIWPGRSYLLTPQATLGGGTWFCGFQGDSPKVFYPRRNCAEYRIFVLRNVDKRQPVDFMLATHNEVNREDTFTASDFTSNFYHYGFPINPTRHHRQGALQFVSFQENYAGFELSLGPPDFASYTMRGPDADVSLVYDHFVDLVSGSYYWTKNLLVVDRVVYGSNENLFEIGGATIGYTPMQTWGGVNAEVDSSYSADSSTRLASWDMTATNTPTLAKALVKTVTLPAAGKYVWMVGLSHSWSGHQTRLRVIHPGGTSSSLQDQFRWLRQATRGSVGKRLALHWGAASATPIERGMYGFEFSVTNAGDAQFRIEVLPDTVSYIAFSGDIQSIEVTGALLGRPDKFVFYKEPALVEKWGPARYMVTTFEKQKGESISYTPAHNAVGNEVLVFSVTPRDDSIVFMEARHQPVGYAYSTYSAQTGFKGPFQHRFASTAGGQGCWILDRHLLPWRYESNASSTPVRGKYYWEVHTYNGNATSNSLLLGVQAASRGFTDFAFQHSRKTMAILGGVTGTSLSTYRDDQSSDVTLSSSLSYNYISQSMCWGIGVNYSASRIDWYLEGSLIHTQEIFGDLPLTPMVACGQANNTFLYRGFHRVNTTGPFQYPKPAGFVAYDWLNEVSL